MADSIVAGMLAGQVDQLLQTCARGAKDMTVEQLRDSHGDKTNSAGFDVWHIARTVDNVIHFVFAREKPVWMVQGLAEAWNFPKNDQGTGMDAATAYALEFPEASVLTGYVDAVRTAAVPKIEAMSDEYLNEVVKIVPFGDLPRMQVITQVLVGHGNAHMGRLDMHREFHGLGGLGI